MGIRSPTSLEVDNKAIIRQREIRLMTWLIEESFSEYNLSFCFKMTTTVFVFSKSGQLGTIREGLTHLLIPNGWSWNGPASIYCPIWIELKTEEVDGSS